MTVTLLPPAIYLLIPGNFSWGLWAVYFVFMLVVHASPYILMLHCTSHRKLFKKPYAVLNYWIPVVLGPLVGEPSPTYYLHHVGMHHPENNMEDDRSSTLRYQRDSFLGFLQYFFTFLLTDPVNVPRYFARKGRVDQMRSFMVGEYGFYVLVLTLGLVGGDFRGPLMVLVVPVVLIRALMMAGNWGQHAFIDARDPGNSYKNSITCINSAYNRRCFNDGYHISHHVKPGMHWSEHPDELKKNLQKYIDAGSIVFEGIDFGVVWFYLMLKRYDLLAKRYVDIADSGMTQQEIAEFLRSRTRPVLVASESASAALA